MYLDCFYCLTKRANSYDDTIDITHNMMYYDGLQCKDFLTYCLTACVKEQPCKSGHLSRVAGRKMWSMILRSYGVVEIRVMQSGGEFSSLLYVQAVVNHVLSTVVNDSAVMQLIVAESLQRPNQGLYSVHQIHQCRCSSQVVWQHRHRVNSNYAFQWEMT